MEDLLLLLVLLLMQSIEKTKPCLNTLLNRFSLSVKTLLPIPLLIAREGKLRRQAPLCRYASYTHTAFGHRLFNDRLLGAINVQVTNAIYYSKSPLLVYRAYEDRDRMFRIRYLPTLFSLTHSHTHLPAKAPSAHSHYAKPYG